MDEPGAVRLVERVGDLDTEAENLFRRERSLFQPLRERLAFEELHDEILDARLHEPTSWSVQMCGMRELRDRS